MNYVLKFLLWAVGIIAALLLTIVALQIFYRLTPVELSDEAKALLEETKHMAQLTENGYRLRGIKAPLGMSPVAYGRCLDTENERDYSATLTEQDASDIKARWERVDAVCLQGKRAIAQPWTKGMSGLIKPGFSEPPAVAPTLSENDTELRARWNEVLTGGARGWSPALHAIFPPYEVAAGLELMRALSVLRHWRNDDRSLASSEFREAIHYNVEFAHGNLLETMIAVSSLSRHLLVAQASVSRARNLPSDEAATLRKALAPIEKLRDALRVSIAAEFQLSVHFWRNLQKASKRDATADWWMRFSDYVTDSNDTLNVSANANLLAQRSLDGTDIRADLASFRANVEGCAWLGEYSFACIPFQRNPLARMTASMSTPYYADYGRRVDDVRTLAAATRLTIEARARGLQGEQLAAFVANAAADMRDAATGEPFAYNAQTKLLTIKLQTKSSVLGEKSYNLPL